MAAGSLNLEDARALLRTVIRSIDKRTEFTVTLKEGDQPAAVVALALRGNKTTVTIPIAQISAALEGAIPRNQLRTKLKRTIELMSFKPSTITSTKMLTGSAVEGGYFRTQSGNRGGGGRR
ncbi:MAG TPA: hypothetical protein VEB21_17365 [Terriglobales bacterium]|nr:hypothetical protein [Terriglobales bacterium]